MVCSIDCSWSLSRWSLSRPTGLLAPAPPWTPGSLSEEQHGDAGEDAGEERVEDPGLAEALRGLVRLAREAPVAAAADAAVPEAVAKSLLELSHGARSPV